jgi:hypothetical protein
MGRFMNLGTITVFSIFLSASSWSAQEKETMKTLGSELRACFENESSSYASTSCLHPSELIPAIKSKCRTHTNNLHSFIVDAESERMANDVTNGFLVELEQDAAAIIVDIQSASKRCSAN